MENKLTFVVCENMADDFLAAKALLGIRDLEIQTYPSYCSSLKPARPADLAALVDGVSLDSLQVVSCRTCPILKQARVLGLDCHGFDHVFALLLDGGFLFDEVRKGGYFLTAGWLSQAGDHLARFGFEGETLALWFKTAIRKLYYLNGKGAEDQDPFFDLARQLDLPCQVIPIRYDYLKLFMESQHMRWLMKREKHKKTQEIRDLRQSVSDYSAMFQIIHDLPGHGEERELIDHMLQTFRMVFGAGKARYWTDDGGFDPEEKSRLQTRTYCETDQGFIVAVDSAGGRLGYVEIGDLTFPEYRHKYISFLLNVSKVLGMAIVNLRNVQEIKRMGAHDALTGLYNRTKYEEIIGCLSDQALFNMAVMVVDIDGLKEMNDTCGHEMGDRLIKRTAALLQESFRKRDDIFRIGGDEFVVLMEIKDMGDLASLEDRLARRMKKASAENCRGQAFAFSFSYGGARFAPGDKVYTDMFRRADAKMYAMKAEKRSKPQ